MVLEVLEPALFLARLETHRAKMLAVEFAIAQGAEKTPARLAGDDRFFLWMIKAAGFPFDQQVLADLAFDRPFEVSRKEIDFNGGGAGRAGNQFGRAENFPDQRSVAFGAGDQALTHRRAIKL